MSASHPVPPGIRIRLADIPRFEERERADDIERALAARDVARQARADLGVATSPAKRSDHENSHYRTVAEPHSNRVEQEPQGSPVMWSGVTNVAPRTVVAEELANAASVTGTDAAQRSSGTGAMDAFASPEDPVQPDLRERDHDLVIEMIAGESESATANSSPAASRRRRLADKAEMEPHLHWLLKQALLHESSDGADADRHVEAARELLDADAVVRRARKDTEPSSRTQRKYGELAMMADRRRRALADERSLPSIAGVPWLDVAADYGDNRRTFHSLLAALRHRARQHLIIALDKQQNTCASERPDLHAAWLRVLRLAADEIRFFSALTFEAVLQHRLARDGAAPVRRKRSKKDVLPHLLPDWRERLLAAERGLKHEFAVAVLLRTGARPEELEAGIDLTRVGSDIRVRIDGAKVRETAGQPERKFLLAAESLPASLLKALEAAGDVLTVQAPEGAMRKHLERKSRVVLRTRTLMPGEPRDLLSAYVFRHALVSDMRDAGWTDAEIAPAIGERSAKTVRDNYGEHGRPSRGGSVAIRRGSVEVTRPVKPLPPAKEWFASKVMARGSGDRAPRRARR